MSPSVIASVAINEQRIPIRLIVAALPRNDKVDFLRLQCHCERSLERVAINNTG